MASLKDIRKRIQSVQNTRQITRAMKMVAAAKLRRSQEAILGARPYAYRIYSILLYLATRDKAQHPLLVSRDEKKVRLIVLAGDRGLCGSFNTSIFKEADRFLRQRDKDGVKVILDVIGKKANDYYRRRREIGTFHEDLLSKTSFQRVAAIANEILSSFQKEECDAIYLVYNEFKSAIQQRVTVERLVPIALEPPPGVAQLRKFIDEERFKNYLFEPSKEKLLNEIIPRHYQVQFFRSVLESIASEHGARMSAMENATKNASEMIEGLTLQYNKARQASITKELMEIVSGVEAMR